MIKPAMVIYTLIIFLDTKSTSEFSFERDFIVTTVKAMADKMISEAIMIGNIPGPGTL